MADIMETMDTPQRRQSAAYGAVHAKAQTDVAALRIRDDSNYGDQGQSDLANRRQ